MPIDLLLPLVAVFTLGAMSPGPSLAVVLRNSLVGGRRHGVMTGLGHALGFGIYAFMAALGIAAAISANAALADVIRWGGIALLIYLAYMFARSALSGHSESDNRDVHAVSSRTGFVQGFSIALLNPKILAWLLAIYSPVIGTDQEVPILLAVALMGMCIDGGWYVSVALFLTTGGRDAKLRAASGKLDGVMAVLMLVFAVLLGFDLV
jgi:threonine/homoserine/homoserine lactone efflux protein